MVEITFELDDEVAQQLEERVIQTETDRLVEIYTDRDREEIEAMVRAHVATEIAPKG
jgi:hypothetical protein